MCRIDPSKPKAWCILGKYYLGQKEFGKSISPLKQCQSSDSSSDNIMSYAIALFDYGNVDVAMPLYHF